MPPIQSLDQIRAFGRTPSWVDQDPPEGVSVVNAAAAAYRDAAAILAKAQADIAAAGADADLTTAGQAKRKAKIAADALAKLAELRRTKLGPVQSKRDGLAEKEREAAEPSLSETERVLRGMEIIELRRLMPSDALEVQTLYSQALADGDTLMMDAIESLPRLHGGRLSDDVLAELQTRRAAERPASPELQLLRTAHDDVASALDLAERELGSMPQPAEPDDGDTTDNLSAIASGQAAE